MCWLFFPQSLHQKRTLPAYSPGICCSQHSEHQSEKCFTVFDAFKGCHPRQAASHHVHLDGTNFCVLTFGISSISEHYDHRMYDTFPGLSEFHQVVDDIVIYDEDLISHITYVRLFLQRCEDRGISLGKDNFHFYTTEVVFTGFCLSEDGCHISDDITGAIDNFPTPCIGTYLRSFFGLANQLAGGTSNVSATLAPLRPLLSTKNDFLSHITFRIISPVEDSYLYHSHIGRHLCGAGRQQIIAYRNFEIMPRVTQCTRISCISFVMDFHPPVKVTSHNIWSSSGDCDTILLLMVTLLFVFATSSSPLWLHHPWMSLCGLGVAHSKRIGLSFLFIGPG